MEEEGEVEEEEVREGVEGGGGTREGGGGFSIPSPAHTLHGR